MFGKRQTRAVTSTGSSAGGTGPNRHHTGGVTVCDLGLYARFDLLPQKKSTLFDISKSSFREISERSL